MGWVLETAVGWSLKREDRSLWYNQGKGLLARSWVWGFSISHCRAKVRGTLLGKKD